MPHPRFQFQQDGACESHPFKRNNEILILIKTENTLIKRIKMKLFATAALATTVFAATKSRFTDDAAAGLVIEHDASIGSRSRRAGNPDTRSDNCKSAKENRRDIFRYSTSHGFHQCVFSSLLDLHKTNIRRAMWFIYENMDKDKQLQGKELVENADDGFHGIIDDWKILTGGFNTRETHETLNCGWEPLDITSWARKMDLNEHAIKEGFFGSCAGMCNLIDLSINNVKESKLMVKETLNMFLMIIADYFGVMAQIKADTNLGLKELPQCRLKGGEWNQLQQKYIQAKWINSKGKGCTDADKCGQIVRNIFRKVSLFEEFIGETIPSLVEYDDDYKKDLTRLEGPENLKKGQNGQKIITKILR